MTSGASSNAGSGPGSAQSTPESVAAQQRRAELDGAVGIDGSAFAADMNNAGISDRFVTADAIEDSSAINNNADDADLDDSTAVEAARVDILATYTQSNPLRPVSPPVYGPAVASLDNSYALSQPTVTDPVSTYSSSTTAPSSSSASLTAGVPPPSRLTAAPATATGSGSSAGSGAGPALPPRDIPRIALTQIGRAHV